MQNLAARLVGAFLCALLVAWALSNPIVGLLSGLATLSKGRQGQRSVWGEFALAGVIALMTIGLAHLFWRIVPPMNR